MALYLATDGSYGDATNLVIIDVDHWTDDDYAVIDDLADSSRLDFAEAVTANPRLRPTEWEAGQ
jgi:hypothetical protein